MFGSYGRHVGALGNEKPKKKSRLHTFEHTHLGVYVVGVFTVACIFIDSSQGVTEKYQVGKKWFYLYGILCSFSYVYVRPLIRRGLGSAQDGYLNYYAIYIFWLCSAVFYHLPKLEDLGMDLKADISVMMSTFMVSFSLISLMHGLHRLAVTYDVISPFLISPSDSTGALWAAIMINSTSLALACSTYFSFCGNTVVYDGATSRNGIKDVVCQNWLQPVRADKYPTFRAWVPYSACEDAPGTDSFGNQTMQPIEIPVAEDASVNDMFKKHMMQETEIPAMAGSSCSVFCASEAISPVLMIWLTLLTMYLVNCTADHLAVREIDVMWHVSQLRRTLSDSTLSSLVLHDNQSKLCSRSRSKSLDLNQGSGSSETFKYSQSPRMSRANNEHNDD